MMNSNGYEFKIVLLGESGIGKSCIAYRMHRNIFKSMDTTIGAAFYPIRINNILYQLWDTAGQERYRSMVPHYTRNADVLIMVYDLTDLTTLDFVHENIKKIQYEQSNPYKILVVGNKCDLLDLTDLYNKQKEVEEEMSKYKDIGLLFVSAKSGHNFDKLFHTIETHCESIKEYKDRQKYANVKVDLEAPNTSKTAKSQCPCSS